MIRRARNLLTLIAAVALVPTDARADLDESDEGAIPLITNVGTLGPSADPHVEDPSSTLRAPFPLPPADDTALGRAPTANVAKLRKRRTDADGKRAELTEALSAAHTETLKRGRAYYRLTRAGMLPIAGGFDAFVRHAMRVSHARRLAVRALDKEQTLRDRRDELAKLVKRTDEEIAKIGNAHRLEVASLEEAESASRSEAAFERAFSSSAGPAPFVSVDEPEPALDTRGFARMRGRLLFPVAGSADVRAAKAIEGDGPGLEILSKRGSVVRAVYAGRIAFADHYGSFGKIVIVDHGGHYYSVSGNLETVDVRVGDEVSGGERLGSIGVRGGESFLYFELRKESDTIDARPWLGL